MRGLVGVDASFHGTLPRLQSSILRNTLYAVRSTYYS